MCVRITKVCKRNDCSHRAVATGAAGRRRALCRRHRHNVSRGGRPGLLRRVVAAGAALLAVGLLKLFDVGLDGVAAGVDN